MLTRTLKVQVSISRFSYCLIFTEDQVTNVLFVWTNASVLRTWCALLHTGLLHNYVNYKHTVYVRHFYAACIFLSLGGSISLTWPLIPLTHSALDHQGSKPWLMHLHVWCMCLVSLRWGTELKGSLSLLLLLALVARVKWNQIIWTFFKFRD